jgi:hypothetical protein
VTLLALALALLGPAACETAGTGPAPPGAATAAPQPSRVATVSGTPAATAAPSPPTVRVDTLTGTSQLATGAGAYRYSVQVPQLEGLSVRDLSLDPVMRGTLQRDVDDFVQAAANAPDAQQGSDLTCGSQTVRLTGRLAVLRVDCTQYVAGSAHPGTLTQTFNCDLVNARILALQDLFGAGSAYLGVLSNTSRNQLSDRTTQDDLPTMQQGTAPVADNFSAFLLGPNALVIVFARYQVANGTAGQPEVSIPYDSVRRYFASGISDLVAS